MKLLAVIPARGGSKRIPRKNFVNFFGKPLLAHTIEAALESKIFEQVILSSEDREILDYAAKIGGVTALKRKDMLASDTATVMQTVNAVLDEIGESYDFVFILLPSSPLRTATDLLKVRDMLGKEVNSVVSVSGLAFSAKPPIKILPDGSLERDDDAAPSPDALVDNGAIYAIRPAWIQKEKYFPPKTLGYCMPFWASIDIDTPEQLELAKAMYSYFIAPPPPSFVT